MTRRCSRPGNFNPPTSCEVGRAGGFLPAAAARISIHPPPARWDDPSADPDALANISIHPPPARWDNVKFKPEDAETDISIHPPPARWDGSWASYGSYETDFNPPTSCEVGPRLRGLSATGVLFQSTHLLRGGTPTLKTPPQKLKFQSTHLLRGGTLRSAALSPTSPISIHPPPARWDSISRSSSFDFSNFNPPTSCEVGRAG